MREEANATATIASVRNDNEGKQNRRTASPSRNTNNVSRKALAHLFALSQCLHLTRLTFTEFSGSDTVPQSQL